MPMNAIKWFNLALVVKPRWADALYGLAVIHLKLKEYEKSLGYIEEAVESHRGYLKTLDD